MSKNNLANSAVSISAIKLVNMLAVNRKLCQSFSLIFLLCTVINLINCELITPPLSISTLSDSETSTVLTDNDEKSDEAVSFGIRSFTVEVTTSSDKTPAQNTSTPVSVQTSPTSDPVASSLDPVDDDDDTRVEKNLKNGLYRIKIAEIITDEFDNGLSDENEQTREAIASNKLYNQGKINIADLYPSKIEDFSPIIKDSNEKLIRQKHLYIGDNEIDDNNRQSNLITSLNVQQSNPNSNIPTTKIEIELIDESVEPPLPQQLLPVSLSAAAAAAAIKNENVQSKITDFTSQLLRENDRVISTIERSFLTEFKEATATTTVHPLPITINKPIEQRMEFIERRVKKYDPAFKAKFLNPIEHNYVDIANTKFNSDTNDNRENKRNEKPEFSTTKFYNSKELYSEMIHKRLPTIDGLGDGMGISGGGGSENGAGGGLGGVLKEIHTTQSPSTSSAIHQNKNNDYTTTVIFGKDLQTLKPMAKHTYSSRDKTTTVKVGLTDAVTATTTGGSRRTMASTTSTTITPVNAVKRNDPKTVSLSINTPTTIAEYNKTKPKMQIRNIAHQTNISVEDKNVNSTLLANKNQTAFSKTTTPSSSMMTTGTGNGISSTVVVVVDDSVATTTQQHSQSFSSSLPSTSSVSSASASSSSSSVTPHPLNTTPTNEKSTTIVTMDTSTTIVPLRNVAKSYSRPRVITRLQEKINSLECDMQNVPVDSNVWRGNETHELCLPNMVS